jgi:hypothetical protein
VEDAVVRVRKPGELENPAGFDPTAAGGGRRGGNRKGGGKKGNFKKAQN